MRHLLSTRTLSREQAVRILDVAEDMADVALREVKKLPTLRGKSVVNLFFEDSTRTRISFEAAAKRLSADVINFSAKGSSVSKGESLKDTAQTLAAMGADAVVVRHSASGAPQVLADSGWIDDDRLANLDEHSMVMHPGPMNRGLEISAKAADSPRSSVREQVANGVSVRMAVLYLLLSGDKEEV
jgi:aspartate carbamoyltransferase catalytic subunit